MKRRKNNRFFIQEHLQRENLTHGGVGNVDIERLLVLHGFVPVSFPFHSDFSLKAKLFRTFYLIRMALTLPGNSVVVFQMPLYARMDLWLVSLIKMLRPSVKLICFLTDINGLRDNDPKELQREIRLYRKLSYFIVHTSAMQQWLLQYHPSAQCSRLAFFDFLTPFNGVARQKAPTLVFAGNLDKSRFVMDLNKVSETEFFLYGPLNDFPLKKMPNVHYCGILPPQQLPFAIKGAFGLVWDGDSITSLAGTSGDYSRYNSPHKLSLYVLSGLPVIAHADSGAAEMIELYGIGLLVRSLHDVKNAIDNLSEEEYNRMHNNCLQLAKKISTGYFTCNALAGLDIDLT